MTEYRTLSAFEQVDLQRQLELAESMILMQQDLLQRYRKHLAERDLDVDHRNKIIEKAFETIDRMRHNGTEIS